MSSTRLPGHLARTTPSLALIKYWGKSDQAENRPATPSLAISLRELATETRVWAIDGARYPGAEAIGDRVVVGGNVQDPERFRSFFDAARASLDCPRLRFWAESRNNFPTAAGLASSSSGFAALSLGIARACGLGTAGLGPELLDRLSGLARQGSGSAARALYGGFTLLPADSLRAESLFGAAHWPELRVIVVRISESAKELSSRVAMERSRTTSPYYRAWVEDAPGVCQLAQQHLEARDLDALGPLIQASYLRMFATMFSATPPVIYWKPESLTVIKLCQSLREQGVGAWETMDAGPQVKIFCLAKDLEAIQAALGSTVPGCGLLVDAAGDGPSLPGRATLLGPVAPELQAAAAGLGLELAEDAGSPEPAAAGA